MDYQHWLPLIQRGDDIMFTELAIKDYRTVMGVYAIRCEETRRFYIGSSPHIWGRYFDQLTSLSKGTNLRQRGLWQDDYDNYGESSFKFYLITEIIDPDILRPTEQLFIDMFWNFKNTDGTKLIYNKSKNASGYGIGKNNHFYGKTHTDETKEKISKATSGKKSSSHLKQVLDVTNRVEGRISDEKRKYLSDISKGENNPMYGKEPWNLGVPMSDHVKAKLLEANLGRSLTEEHKAKISKALEGNNNAEL